MVRNLGSLNLVVFFCSFKNSPFSLSLLGCQFFSTHGARPHPTLMSTIPTWTTKELLHDLHSSLFQKYGASYNRLLCLLKFLPWRLRMWGAHEKPPRCHPYLDRSRNCCMTYTVHYSRKHGASCNRLLCPLKFLPCRLQKVGPTPITLKLNPMPDTWGNINVERFVFQKRAPAIETEAPLTPHIRGYVFFFFFNLH